MKINIIMPTHIEIWVKKKKKIPISLNRYRNAHFQISNKIKQVYKKILEEQIDICYYQPMRVQFSIEWKIKLETPIGACLTYYHWTNHKSDIDNYCAIQSKFLQDWLVELGVIPEDNYDYVQEIVYKSGGYDKWNSRVEIEIYSLNK